MNAGIGYGSKCAARQKLQDSIGRYDDVVLIIQVAGLVEHASDPFEIAAGRRCESDFLAELFVFLERQGAEYRTGDKIAIAGFLDLILDHAGDKCQCVVTQTVVRRKCDISQVILTILTCIGAPVEVYDRIANPVRLHKYKFKYLIEIQASSRKWRNGNIVLNDRDRASDCVELIALNLQ